MRIHSPEIIAGVAAIISGIVLNYYAIVPHYNILAYDRSVWSKLTSTGYSQFPGTPAVIAIPPINYTMIAVGCGLIVIGILLLLAVLSRRKGTSLKPEAN